VFWCASSILPFLFALLQTICVITGQLQSIQAISLTPKSIEVINCHQP
jgi:hypothetical protein